MALEQMIIHFIILQESKKGILAVQILSLIYIDGINIVSHLQAIFIIVNIFLTK